MNDTTQYESIQEPLDEEERKLMNPENWDWDNPVEATVAEILIVELPIELTYEETRAIAQAARAQGLTTHAFIKQVSLAVAHAIAPCGGNQTDTAHAATA
jgi:hypothetical protein